MRMGEVAKCDFKSVHGHPFAVPFWHRKIIIATNHNDLLRVLIGWLNVPTNDNANVGHAVQAEGVAINAPTKKCRF